MGGAFARVRVNRDARPLNLVIIPCTNHLKMRTRPFLLALALIVAGCGRSAPVDDSSAERAAESAARFTYQCRGGGTIYASYPSDSTAIVEYEGQTFQMTIAISASGARYVGGGLVWWTKGSGSGSEGTLFRHDSRGTTGEAVEHCEQTGSVE